MVCNPAAAEVERPGTVAVDEDAQAPIGIDVEPNRASLRVAAIEDDAQRTRIRVKAAGDLREIARDIGRKRIRRIDADEDALAPAARPQPVKEERRRQRRQEHGDGQHRPHVVRAPPLPYFWILSRASTISWRACWSRNLEVWLPSTMTIARLPLRLPVRMIEEPPASM